MSYANYNHPYYVKFWYPSGTTYDEATYKLKIKAPEVGNSYVEGRRQTVTRAASGNIVVTDLGLLINPQIDLQFKQVPEVERAQVSLFLHTIQFAANRIAYEDYTGVVRTVRMIGSQIRFTDTGLHNKGDIQTQLWDFDFSVLDVSENPSEQDGGIMSSALALHISYANDPHSPTSSEQTMYIGDGDVEIYTFFTHTFRSCVITVECIQGANVRILYALVTHDRDANTDAVSTVVTMLGTANSGSLTCAILAVLSGTGTGQLVRIQVNTNIDNTIMRFKAVVM